MESIPTLQMSMIRASLVPNATSAYAGVPLGAEIFTIHVAILVITLISFAGAYFMLDYAGSGPAQGAPQTILLAYFLVFVGSLNGFGGLIIVGDGFMSWGECFFWANIIRIPFALAVLYFQGYFDKDKAHSNTLSALFESTPLKGDASDDEVKKEQLCKA